MTDTADPRNVSPAAAPPAIADRGPGHILTVSVEEYFHGGALSQVVLRKHWDRFESRIDRSVDDALALLDQHRTKATFFVLGLLADRNPAMVRRIAEAGHEVASRGFWPRGVGGMMAEEFAEDLDRTADAIGAATGKRVLGYRSPRWITPDELWILEVLARRGYAYDASVNPVLRRFRRHRHLHALGRHELPGLPPIWEVPVSTRSLLGLRLGIGGGNWMRQLPQAWMQRSVAQWQQRRAEPLVFYFTSWELDHEQPQITAVSALGRMRQYRNLARLRRSLEGYLQRYRFGSIAEHLGLQPSPAAARHAPAPSSRPIELGAPRTRTPVAVVVPIYNEQDSIAYLLRTLATVEERLGDRYQLEFVLVDDGSRDGSWQVMQTATAGRANFRLVQQPKNQGVARAILAGIQASSCEIVASIDCDCSYDPLEIEHMVPMIDGCDLVTASPYHPSGQVLNVPRWRLFLSRSLSWCYRRLLGVELYTWTSCFRVVRKSKLSQIEVENGGFLGVAEMLLRLVLRGGKVREYPTLLESRLLGVSKMKTLRTIRGHLGMLWRILWRRLR